jgi:hypothetical protein
MGSSRSTSGGGGRSRSSTLKKGTGASGPPGRSYSTASTRPMGPMESIARSGTTGLATATPKEAETIRAATGKSFNAISKNIGEVGSKYRRPADVEKYAKELKTIEEGKAKGAKTFVGPDGVERVSFVGTGMKDEEGRTILSKTTPTLTAKAPTLKELGGDIMRGIMGYNTLEYQGDSNVPTMVKKKGLIEVSPTTALFNAIKGGGFFQYNDSDSKDTTTTTTDTTQEFAESESEAERKRKLAGSLVSSATKGRSLFTTKARTISGGMA